MTDWEEWLLNNQPKFYHPSPINKYHTHDIARLNYKSKNKNKNKNNGRLVKILLPQDSEYLVKYLGTDITRWEKEKDLEPVILWR